MLLGWFAEMQYFSKWRNCAISDRVGPLKREKCDKTNKFWEVTVPIWLGWDRAVYCVRHNNSVRSRSTGQGHDRAVKGFMKMWVVATARLPMLGYHWLVGYSLPPFVSALYTPFIIIMVVSIIVITIVIISIIIKVVGELWSMSENSPEGIELQA